MTQAYLLARARDEGSLEAARELRRLKLDRRRAVDVFRVIVNADLWLLFQPLDRLLGAYVRAGCGILINSQRPRGMQRLTAAHEYAHHVLGHDESTDDEGQVQNPNIVRDPREAAAQAFAMDFLMPPQLVNTLWSDLGVPASPEAYHAYLLALYLGASYQATVHQLFAMGKISDDVRGRLFKVQPRQIKHQIGRGVGPRTAQADIWPVDRSQDHRELTIATDDEVSICLPEAPSTGYLWVTETSGVIDLRAVQEGSDPTAAQAPSRFSTGPFNISTQEGPQSDAEWGWRPGDTAEPGPEHVLGLVRSEFEAAERNLFSAVGGGGHRYFTFRALRPGKCDLRLTLRRPWLPTAEPVEEFTLHLSLLPKPGGEMEQGFFDEAKDLLGSARAA